MGASRYLAFDLGAESGRAFAGTLADGRLSLEEIYRFPNEAVEVSGTLHWDVLALFNHLLKGMREYTRRYGPEVDGIGIDTWGVDFGLLARDGQLLQNPVHHRDHRTRGMVEALDAIVPLKEVFEMTGMGPSSIISSCQLLSMRLKNSPFLAVADRFLMMPDLLGYFLTGVTRCERTNATCTQLYDPRTGQWSEEMIRRLGLPTHIWPELADPGTKLGELLDAVKHQTGLTRAMVIAPCTHDTPAAVAAVPGQGNDWAFISCGTWSVIGALSDGMITDPEVMIDGMANELTLGSSFLCKNITGLFLLQRARAIWCNAGKEYSYPELTELARQAPEHGPIIDPQHEDFISPEDMIVAIRDFCERTGQRPPEGIAETTRCILESLALSYRQLLEQQMRILDRRFNVIHIVGGGSGNTLLCQLTADATGIPVEAGPVETTVAGNILSQAYAMGELASPEEVRAVVRQSATLTSYQPRETERWNDRYAAYCRLQEKVLSNG